VPPFVGIAWNVTDVPLHTGFADGEIEILTVTLVFSTIVMAFDVAGFPVGQGILEFKTQETTSPLLGTYE
jgi:hypothetical protein